MWDIVGSIPLVTVRASKWLPLDILCLIFVMINAFNSFN